MTRYRNHQHRVTPLNESPSEKEGKFLLEVTKRVVKQNPQ